jgi:hypothetical protein
VGGRHVDLTRWAKVVNVEAVIGKTIFDEAAGGTCLTHLKGLWWEDLGNRHSSPRQNLRNAYQRQECTAAERAGGRRACARYIVTSLLLKPLPPHRKNIL